MNRDQPNFEYFKSKVLTLLLDKINDYNEKSRYYFKI